jgi:Lipid A 3-O-deacylase (PagL)
LFTVPPANGSKIQSLPVQPARLGRAARDAGRRLSALGCPLFFHAGVSIGVPITEHWSVLGSFEHLSNGKSFGVNCGTNQSQVASNQGLNNYGLSVGYAF